MKKILSMFLLAFTGLILSGCNFANNTGCKTEAESESNEGTLYVTYCKEDSKSFSGLMNEDFEIVVGEMYSKIDIGFDIYGASQESLEFSSETKYFRVRHNLEDGSYKQSVIDREGTLIYTGEAYDKIIISEDQTKIYNYNINSSIFDIEKGTTSTVDYRIINMTNEYYLAQKGTKWIVLDKSFNQVLNNNYDNVFYVSDELMIYELYNRIFSLNRVNDQVVELISTEADPDYGLFFDDSNILEFLLISPNSDVTFVDFKTGSRVNPEGCTIPLDFPNNYIVMTCENDYKVYDRDDMSYISSIPKGNTDIVPYSDAYFLYSDNQTSLITPSHEIAFDSHVDSFEIRHYFDIITVFIGDKKVYIDLSAIETLFTVNTECNVLGSTHENTLFFTEGTCEVEYEYEDIEVISLMNSKLRLDNLEIMYYTNDWIYLLEDGETKIIDYDLNVLSD